MKRLVVRCPACRVGIRVPASLAREAITCPKCGKEFRAAIKKRNAPSATNVPPPDVVAKEREAAADDTAKRGFLQSSAFRAIWVTIVLLLLAAFAYGFHSWLSSTNARRSAQDLLSQARVAIEDEKYSEAQRHTDRAIRILTDANIASGPLYDEASELRAHLGNGDVLYNGRWVSQEEKDMLAAGFVRHGDRWVTPQQKAKLTQGYVWHDDQVVTPEEKENLSRGLVNYRGQWMSPADVTRSRTAIAVPIIGEITEDTVKVVERAVEKAQASDVGNVVLIIDSPGGVVAATTRIASLLDRIPNAHLSAYIDSENFGGAWSAGAFLAFCCDDIYVRRGAALGAAQMLISMPEGLDIPVEELPAGEKYESAWLAQLRARAEQHGHPSAIVEAMANKDSTLWFREEATERAFATRKPASREDGWVRLKTEGQILSLTALEMERLGLSISVTSLRDVGEALGLQDPDLANNAFYRSEVHALQVRARELKAAEIELEKKIEQLAYRLGAMGIRGAIQNPYASARELAGRLSQFEDDVRAVRRLSADVISLAKEHPGLGVPPDAVAYLGQVKLLFELMEREAIPEARKEIVKQREAEQALQRAEQASRQAEQIATSLMDEIAQAEVQREAAVLEINRWNIAGARQRLSRAGYHLKRAGQYCDQAAELATKNPELGVSPADLQTFKAIIRAEYERLKVAWEMLR